MSNTPRIAFIDFDARRTPKTDRWCIMCQRDLKPSAKARRVRVIDIGGGPYSIHPEDEATFDALGGRLPDHPDEQRDLGQQLIGLDCARKHGLEWTKPE